MRLEDIAEYLVSLDIGLKTRDSEKNLFVNYMGPKIPKGVLIRESYMGTPINHYLPDYFRTSFQIIVRDSDYVEGRRKADMILESLTVKQSRTIGTMSVRQILPRHEPLVYPVSEGNRLEWSMNFDAAYSV